MPFSQKNRLPCRNQSGYISAAPHKTGAGIATPADNYSAQPRQRFFCAYRIATSFSHTNYGGAYGADFGRAGFCSCRWLQPRTSHHPELQPLDGEFSKLTNKEATPWQTANSTAHTLRVVTSRLKSTADFPAHSASLKSCTSICCMSVAANFQTSIHPLFSAIWRMICASFSSSSSSKTNAINSCSGPFLHLAAGGLRTSVTRGLPQ
mgnify:CR=1 FL=1